MPLGVLLTDCNTCEREWSQIAGIFADEGLDILAGRKPRELAAVDLAIKIPMCAGVDPLNLAAASALAFWGLRPR